MIDLHSPNWFKCALSAQYVKPVIQVKRGTKARHIMIEGSIVSTVTRYPLEEMKELYFRQFFMINPMDCLRVYFNAKCYIRVK